AASLSPGSCCGRSGACRKSATPSFAVVSFSKWSISIGAASIGCSSPTPEILATRRGRSRIDRTHGPVRLAGLGSMETARMSFVVPQRNQALVIRRARASDAGTIAQVHVRSWRESYRGIVPDGYLAQMSVAAHERQWRQSLAAGGWAFVAEWEQR